MTRTQRNLLRVPGLLLRVPLLCLAYYVLEPVITGIERLCERYLPGLDR